MADFSITHKGAKSSKPCAQDCSDNVSLYVYLPLAYKRVCLSMAFDTLCTIVQKMHRNPMKNYVLSSMLLLLGGCSGLTYINTGDYSAQLNQQCLSRQQQDNEDIREQCQDEAQQDTEIAERIYELRQDKDKQRCREKPSDEPAAGHCFQQAQQPFYDLQFPPGREQSQPATKAGG